MKKINALKQRILTVLKYQIIRIYVSFVKMDITPFLLVIINII